MQNGKIRTAVVGAGKMGAIHAKVYDQLPQSELVAVVDIVAQKAENLASNITVQLLPIAGIYWATSPNAIRMAVVVWQLKLMQ